MTFNLNLTFEPWLKHLLLGYGVTGLLAVFGIVLLFLAQRRLGRKARGDDTLIWVLDNLVALATLGMGVAAGGAFLWRVL